MRRVDKWFTLRYYEVVKAVGGMAMAKTVSNVERKIEAGDLDGGFEGKRGFESDTYVVRRNASFWSRGRGDGGWDCQ